MSTQTIPTAAEILAYHATGWNGDESPMGLLADDVSPVALAHLGWDVEVRTVANGSTWVAPKGGGRAWRVLCAEIVEHTYPESAERFTSRCGHGTVDGSPFCAWHHPTDREGTRVDLDALCSHGLSAWLCSDPIGHYPVDL